MPTTTTTITHHHYHPTNQNTCSHEHQHQPSTLISHAILTYIFHNNTTIILHPPCTHLPPEVAGTLTVRTLGMSPLHGQQLKEVTITLWFWSITTTTTNTMLIITIIMSKMQFLLLIHRKDLFLLPTPTEMVFSTTNSPRFYSLAIHLSPIIPVFWGLLVVISQNNCLPTKFSLLSTSCWFLTEGSPYQNLWANPCFLLSESDLPVTELQFWYAANWAPDLSAPNFAKSSQFPKDWWICIKPVPLRLDPAKLNSRPCMDTRPLLHHQDNNKLMKCHPGNISLPWTNAAHQVCKARYVFINTWLDTSFQVLAED